MALLPNFDDGILFLNWTRDQKIIYLSVAYLDILIYGIVVLLALRNIWVIVLKQKEYKNLPILTFYVFAMIATTLRPIYIIWVWTADPVIQSVDDVQ